MPSRKPGERLRAGDVIGTVAEHRFTHKIMIPFAEPGDVELCDIEGGDFSVEEPVAHIVNAAGRQRAVTLSQEWRCVVRYRSACCAVGCVSDAIPWNR